jgi:hypothetical protein
MFESSYENYKECVNNILDNVIPQHYNINTFPLYVGFMNLFLNKWDMIEKCNKQKLYCLFMPNEAISIGDGIIQHLPPITNAGVKNRLKEILVSLFSI